MGTGPATLTLQIVNKQRVSPLDSSRQARKLLIRESELGFLFVFVVVCFVEVTFIHPTAAERFREIINSQEFQLW